MPSRSIRWETLGRERTSSSRRLRPARSGGVGGEEAIGADAHVEDANGRAVGRRGQATGKDIGPGGVGVERGGGAVRDGIAQGDDDAGFGGGEHLHVGHKEIHGGARTGARGWEGGVAAMIAGRDGLGLQAGGMKREGRGGFGQEEADGEVLVLLDVEWHGVAPRFLAGFELERFGAGKGQRVVGFWRDIRCGRPGAGGAGQGDVGIADEERVGGETVAEFHAQGGTAELEEHFLAKSLIMESGRGLKGAVDGGGKVTGGPGVEPLAVGGRVGGLAARGDGRQEETGCREQESGARKVGSGHGWGWVHGLCISKCWVSAPGGIRY